jgi:hypothetical protein
MPPQRVVSASKTVESFEPSMLEREAMSRILFAFIDLGGYR